MTQQSESRVQSLVRLAASKYGHKLLRNNSGAYSDDTGRVIRYGLGNDSKQLNDVYKSPDLIGWTSVTITPEMVGRHVAIVTGAECKGSDFKGKPRNKREEAQENFLADIRKAGGIAGFVASEEDYYTLIREWYGL